MKQVIVAIILSGASCCAGFAASDYEREFEKLTQERDQALAAAAEPIQRRYRTALEALLRRATQGNDLETALRIKQALAGLSTKLPEAAPRSKSQFVGAWKCENLADGHRGTLDILPDGTFSSGGKRLGQWDVKGKQLILIHDNRGGHSDRFGLPVRAGKLEGKNTMGHNITLERKIE